MDYPLLDTWQIWRCFSLIKNGSKSTIYHSNGDMQDIGYIVNLFDVQTTPIWAGFTYLGFRLKPNIYTLRDWMWLVNKFKKKLCT